MLQAVVHAAKHQTKKCINFLQGYLIGNGVTDSSTDNINIFSLFSSWPLIPQDLAANLTEYKCGTLSNPIGEPSTKSWLVIALWMCYAMLLAQSPADRTVLAVHNMRKKHLRTTSWSPVFYSLLLLH